LLVSLGFPTLLEKPGSPVWMDKIMTNLQRPQSHLLCEVVYHASVGLSVVRWTFFLVYFPHFWYTYASMRAREGGI